MPYRPFLSRIQRLFGAAADDHFERVAEALETGRIGLPARPMSDRELARAIREFKATPVSDQTLRKLATRFKAD